MRGKKKQQFSKGFLGLTSQKLAFLLSERIWLHKGWSIGIISISFIHEWNFGIHFFHLFFTRSVFIVIVSWRIQLLSFLDKRITIVINTTVIWRVIFSLFPVTESCRERWLGWSRPLDPVSQSDSVVYILMSQGTTDNLIWIDFDFLMTWRRTWIVSRWRELTRVSMSGIRLTSGRWKRSMAIHHHGSSWTRPNRRWYGGVIYLLQKKVDERFRPDEKYLGGKNQWLDI